MQAVFQISPDQRFWAFAWGSAIKVFDMSVGTFACLDWGEAAQEETAQPSKKRKKRGKTVDKKQLLPASTVTRFIAFDRSSQYMATGGDDKIIRVWDCASWKIASATPPATVKKYTDGLLCGEELFVADKFGDVSAFDVPTLKNEREVLGHFSLITSMLLRGGAQPCLITGDADGHIRVSRSPACHDIAAFCLAHTGPVTAMCLYNDFLVSGGEKGELFLWEPLEGKRLGRHAVVEHGPLEEAKEEGFAPYISLLRVTPQGLLLVAINPFPGLLLFRVDDSHLAFAFLSRLDLPAVPAELKFAATNELCVWAGNALLFFNLDGEGFSPSQPSPAQRVMCEGLHFAGEQAVITHVEDFARRKIERVKRNAETQVRMEANREKVRMRVQQEQEEEQERDDSGSEDEGDA